MNPYEGQPISFCSAVRDLESKIEKKLGLNPHEIQLISFLPAVRKLESEESEILLLLFLQQLHQGLTL